MAVLYFFDACLGSMRKMQGVQGVQDAQDMQEMQEVRVVYRRLERKGQGLRLMETTISLILVHLNSKDKDPRLNRPDKFLAWFMFGRDR